MLYKITPLILTYNESANIERTLKCLTWAQRIVVVDSYSTDETLQILKRFPQVEIVHRTFDTHANQWNFGLQQIHTEWVLSLDADYRLSDELLVEMRALDLSSSIDSYFIPFKYCVAGKPLRGTLLPPRQALFRRDQGIYVDDGHTQLVNVRGQSSTLRSPIFHDDRKPLARWLWAQDRYALLEVKKLLDTPIQELSWGDRLRRHTLITPLVILLYCLILRQGILDGWAGWYYAFQRAVAEIILTIRLIEAQRFQ